MRKLLLGLVWVYQHMLQPLMKSHGGPRAGCKFHPSCSDYAQQALAQHGAGRGTWLTAQRLCRCHPWSTGGVDPVPKV